MVEKLAIIMIAVILASLHLQRGTVVEEMAIIMCGVIFALAGFLSYSFRASVSHVYVCGI